MRVDKINVVGEVHSNLTIIEMLPSKKMGTSYYKQVLCKCSCGNIKEFSYKYLKRGDTKSCGCISLKKDVVNKTWGSWTYKSEGFDYIDTKGNSLRTIKVECVCGTVKDITLNSLESGMSKSCGCTRKKAAKKYKTDRYDISLDIDKKWVDLCDNNKFMVSSLGEVYNKKLCRIVKKERVNKGSRFYEKLYTSFFGEFNKKDFRIIFLDDDRNNLNIDNLYLANITKNGETWLSNLKYSMNSCSAGRGHTKPEISTKNIVDKYNEQNGLSYFLKIPFDLTAKDKLRAISVDRIDNSKPYSKDNFTLVTRFENMGRSDNYFEDMYEFCKKIKQNIFD
jgi:hypothetical protein